MTVGPKMLTDWPISAGSTGPKPRAMVVTAAAVSRVRPTAVGGASGTIGASKLDTPSFVVIVLVVSFLTERFIERPGIRVSKALAKFGPAASRQSGPAAGEKEDKAAA
jgi:hypothetical protein